MTTPITQNVHSSSGGVSLSELYNQGLKAMQTAERMSRSDSRQDFYIKSRRLFEQAMDLVETLSLFSDNETIDDVATNDLKYLLLPAYLAKILISSECGSNRADTFAKTEILIRKFFHRILKYGLADRRIEAAFESNADKSTPSPSANSDLESAMRNRSAKIEKYKKMKLLENRLAELEEQLDQRLCVDDEVMREYYLSLIKKWIEDSLESLEYEVRPALHFERSLESRVSPPSTSQVRSKALPNTITIVKDQLQKQVFGLGYPSRPTVTVDEFINKKISDGDLSFQAHKEVYANSLQRYAEKPDLLREQEELSDVEHEEKEERDDADELLRKRQWDEFKDENPRGSGNRHNMG